MKRAFEFEEKVIELGNSYIYLGLEFTTSGVFSLARNLLYKKGLKAFYKLCKIIPNLQPSIKTSLHIFDYTMKPISLYGSEIWGVFNINSNKFKNENSLDKIFSGNEPNRLHIKFAKYILGVDKKSTHFAVLSEPGRFPCYIDIVRSMLNYWYRLEHLDKDSLLFNVLETCKEYDASKTSWITSVHSLCSMIKLPPSLIHKRFPMFKKEAAEFIKKIIPT